MTTNTGTYDISDLAAARFQSAAEFGLDTIAQVLAEDNANHNAIVTEMVAEMAEVSTDRQRIYGTSASGDMVEVDEYGKAPTQKNLTGVTTAFPLRLFQYNIGWTAKWLQVHTPADMAMAQDAAQKAHWREITRQIKKAAYISANYTFLDHLVDNVSLDIKRFVNADGANIPDGPNGETFTGSSHTHYNGSASLTAAALLANINDVIEHGHGGDVKVVINTADEAAVRLLPGYTAYQDPRLVFGASTTGIPGTRLDISRLDNRAIGIFGGAEVMVKSWAIANYAFAWDAAGSQKPFVFRQRDTAALQGLRVAAENADYPLYSKFMESEFGVGVWTRTNGAILDFAHASYTDPIIA